MEMSLLDESDVLSARAELCEPFQLGNSKAWPVKLLTVKPRFAHFRHGVPDRSSARRLALIKPVLALGPSLGLPVGLVMVVVAGLALWSIVPSSLL